MGNIFKGWIRFSVVYISKNYGSKKFSVFSKMRHLLHSPKSGMITLHPASETNVMKIYCISGIGADRRLFKYLRPPAGFELVFLEWIQPAREESLADYARRLSLGINTSEPFILLGLSLGGIVSVEIAKRCPPVCTIIIGSVSLSSQLPLHYKIAKQVGLPALLPASFFKFASFLKRSFSSEMKEDRQMLKQMIREGDDVFIKWGINAVLTWENETAPTPLWHIHGTRDEVFPVSATKPTHVIRGGGHMLTITHAEKINEIVLDVIGKTVSSTQPGKGPG